MRKRSYTIAEAAELTGLTRKAIARRVERGSLQSLVRGGRRMVPHAELERAGLVPSAGGGGASEDAGGALSPQGPIGEAELAQVDSSVVSALVRELVERLERQAGEIAHFRALTAEAESLRLEREIGDLRARLATLENGGRPQEPGGESLLLPAGVAAPSFHPAGRPGHPGETLWLPPSATGTETAAAGQAPAPAGPPRPRMERGRPPFRLPGWMRIVLDVLFICAVAAVTVAADLRAEYGIGAVIAPIAAAWLIVIAFEWIRSPYRRA